MPFQFAFDQNLIESILGSNLIFSADFPILNFGLEPTNRGIIKKQNNIFQYWLLSKCYKKCHKECFCIGKCNKKL